MVVCPACNAEVEKVCENCSKCDNCCTCNSETADSTADAETSTPEQQSE